MLCREGARYCCFFLTGVWTQKAFPSSPRQTLLHNIPFQISYSHLSSPSPVPPPPLMADGAVGPQGWRCRDLSLCLREQNSR